MWKSKLVHVMCSYNFSLGTYLIKLHCMTLSCFLQSCLIKRFCEKRFVSKYMATLGIDFGVSKMKIGDHNVRVNIFDMAGQPFFFEVRTTPRLHSWIQQSTMILKLCLILCRYGMSSTRTPKEPYWCMM